MAPKFRVLEVQHGIHEGQHGYDGSEGSCSRHLIIPLDIVVKMRTCVSALASHTHDYVTARRLSLNPNWTQTLNKWDESGFRPLLCTCRLNWSRRTFWGWWDEWDDTALQTQDSKFEPWRSEVEHATYRSRRLPAILFYEWMGEKHFCFFQTAETWKRAPNSSVKGSGAKHYPRAPPAQTLDSRTPLKYDS